MPVEQVMPADRPSAKPFAIPGLDGLRAFSVLLVMASHSGLEHVVPGVFGVTVFFFISGFLITTLLLREHEATGRIALREFYIRRALRLFPPLLALVLFCIVVAVLRGQPIDPLGLAGALFYFANYLAIFDKPALSAFGAHLWSLAVEEHFYLFFPLLLAGLLARRRVIVAVLLGLCGVALLVRIGVSFRFPALATDYTGMATETRMDGVLAGALAALACHGPKGQPFIDRATAWRCLAGAALLILTSLLLRDPLFRATLRYSIQELALVPLVLAVTVSTRFPWAQRLLERPVPAWIGKRSYALYLWHLALFDLCVGLKPAGWNFAAALALGWLLSFVMAAASYWLIEQPMFKVRRRFGSGHGAIAASGEGGFVRSSSRPRASSLEAMS